MKMFVAFRAPIVRLVCLCAVVTCVVYVAGCSAPPEPAAGPAAPPVAADVYVVRGEIVRLPRASDPTRGFYVRHEAIDEFRGADGSVVGMDAMTMQFPLEDASLLEGFAVGDKVELVWEVTWEDAAAQRTTAVRPLPLETELTFREARPPEAASEPSSPPPPAEAPSNPGHAPSSGEDSPD